MIRDYEHLPIGKYLEILALRGDDSADLRIVGILSGRTEDELMRMPLMEYRALADAASFIYFTPATARPRRAYTIGEYRCAVTDADHLTTAQYIDLKEYAKQDGDRTIESLSCILVPEGHPYGEGYDVIDLQRAIRENLPTTEAAGIRAFFTRRLVRLMRDSLTYSRALTKKLTDEKKRTEIETEMAELSTLLRRNGAGFRRSKAWPVLRAARGPRSIQ